MSGYEFDQQITTEPLTFRHIVQIKNIKFDLYRT